MNTKIIILLSIITLMVTAIAVKSQTSSYTMQVVVAINNTNNNVFIPGVGEQVASTLPSTTTTYTSPPDFYLASYLNDNLISIVFSQESPLSISVRKNKTHHFFTINQNLSNSQTFISFTRGDYFTIKNRMPSIEAGTFLTEISPSFYYPFGDRNPVKLLLSYSDIDIQGKFVFRQGVHTVTLESNKTGTSKILIVNETVG